MELSIIINHYKTPHLLKLCLGYLAKNLPENIEKEIIVVDGQSQKETQKMIAGLIPSAIIIPFKKNVGFGKMVNEGLKKATGKYILILNADIIIHKKDAVSLMMSYLEKHPETGLVGPKLLNFNGSPQNSCFRFYTPFSILCRRTVLGQTKWGKKIVSDFLMEDADKTKTTKTDWLMGSAFMATKKAIEKVGLFDEKFFLYFEDVDWCKRFWQAGYKVVYFPLAEMYHYHMQSSKKGKGIFDIFFSKYSRVHLLSAIKYFLKWN